MTWMGTKRVPFAGASDTHLGCIQSPVCHGSCCPKGRLRSHWLYLATREPEQRFNMLKNLWVHQPGIASPGVLISDGILVDRLRSCSGLRRQTSEVRAKDVNNFHDHTELE